MVQYRNSVERAPGNFWKAVDYATALRLQSDKTGLEWHDDRLKALLCANGVHGRSGDRAKLLELLTRSERGLYCYEGCTEAELAAFCKQRGIKSALGNPSKVDLVKCLQTADDNPLFDKFRDLPPELRLRVYEFYFDWLANQGVISICRSDSRDGYDDHDDDDNNDNDDDGDSEDGDSEDGDSEDGDSEVGDSEDGNFDDNDDDSNDDGGGNLSRTQQGRTLTFWETPPITQIKMFQHETLPLFYKNFEVQRSMFCPDKYSGPSVQPRFLLQDVSDEQFNCLRTFRLIVRRPDHPNERIRIRIVQSTDTQAAECFIEEYTTSAIWRPRGNLQFDIRKVMKAGSARKDGSRLLKSNLVEILSRLPTRFQ